MGSLSTDPILRPTPTRLSGTGIVLKFFSNTYVQPGMRTIAPDQCYPTEVSGMMAMFCTCATQ